MSLTPNKKIAFVISILLAIVIYNTKYFENEKSQSLDSLLVNSENAEVSLREHSKIFKERIEKVTDGVYVAIGYALSNMIFLEGDDGIVIVDTTESGVVARNILAQFRKKVSNKPLKAIILTHFHIDHIQGAKALVEDHLNQDIEIYAHSTQSYESKKFGHLGPSAFPRGLRQFGRILEYKHESVNSGIGPFLKIPTYPVYSIQEPTTTFSKNLSVVISGLVIEMYHTPGETDDAITIWLPKQKVILPGDNIYESFPNMYAIRGSPARNAYQWYTSLEFTRSLNAEYMVPSHTGPLIGKSYIKSTLTAYRDAIQFVHDQTVRQMNEMVEIDDIVQMVTLPTNLKEHRFLQEFYGTVAWSVRGVYNSYIGWFDGDPVNLYPTTKKDFSKRLSELLLRKDHHELKGYELLLKYADESIERSNRNFRRNKLQLNDELQWALELISYAKHSCENCVQAKTAYVDILIKIATTMKSANARNYYLTCAKEIKNDLNLKVTNNQKMNLVQTLPIDVFMSMIPYQLNAESCDQTVNIKIVFSFTNKNKHYVYELRNCIIQFTPNPEILPKSFDAHLSMNIEVWYSIVKKEKSALVAYASGDVQINGKILAVKHFMSLLDN